MTTVAELIAALGAIAPFDKAAGWDAVGLQVGDPHADAGRVAVCHDATPEVVEAAIEAEVGLLITYHPMLFVPTRSFVDGPHPAGRAYRLAAAGVALGTVHTAFDVATGGAADALAAALGIAEPSGFGPMWGGDSAKVVTFVPAGSVDSVAAAMTAAGGGRIGNYSGCSFRAEGVGVFTAEPGAAPAMGASGVNAESELRLEMNAPADAVDAVVAALVGAHPYEEPAYDVYERRGDAAMLGRQGPIAKTTLGDLADMLVETLACQPRVAGDRAASISSAAVLPGSGDTFIITADANVVVTGDVAHHQARAALERGIAVIDAGHAATERPGVRALYAAVSQVADSVDLTSVDADPWT